MSAGVVEPSQTLLDMMTAHFSEEKRSQIIAAVDAMHLDPDSPQVVLTALAGDLEEIAARVPDRIADATATLEERSRSVGDDIVHAFQEGITLVKAATPAFVAEQLTTFQVAFDKVAASRVDAVVKAAKASAEAPWTKWMFIAVSVVGLLLMFAGGVFTGRLQGRAAATACALSYPQSSSAMRSCIVGDTR